LRISVLRRSFLSAAAVLFAAAAAACAPTVDGTNTALKAFQVTIVDPQGLVLAASSRAPLGDLEGVARDGVNQLPDPNEIWVSWDALPCQTRPSIELSRAGDDRITIEVDPGPRRADPCSDMSAGYGVRLVLKEPVEVDEITFSTAEGEEP
jgi:hypothetical protein